MPKKKVPDFYSHYGWYSNLYELSNGNPIIMDYWLNMKVTEFLYALCYVNDKNKMERFNSK